MSIINAVAFIIVPIAVVSLGVAVKIWMNVSKFLDSKSVQLHLPLDDPRHFHRL